MEPKKIYRLNTFELQVVNTGSGSGMHDFNYDDLPLLGFNFALGPQSLVHDYNILKNYFSYFKKGCIVIIPICPFSGMIVKYSKEHNFKYYPMLHPATIENFDEEERTRAYRFYHNPIETINLTVLLNMVKDELYKIKGKLKCKSQNPSLQKSADDFIRGWKSQFSIDDLSLPISETHKADINKRKKTLGDMLDFCAERSFKPIVVMLPMHPTLHQQIPDIFRSQYIEPLIRIVLDKGFQFLDYTKDERFMKDDLYANALFLNEIGAKYFTKQLLTDLKVF